MFTFKFSFEADVLAFFFVLATVSATLKKNLGDFSPNLLVALFASATALTFFSYPLILGQNPSQVESSKNSQLMSYSQHLACKQ
jgi:hypothetical protein